MADDTMEAWVKSQLHLNIDIPKLEVGRGWRTLYKKTDYSWNLQWNNADIELRTEQNDLYRLYYQNGTMTLDFTRDFTLNR
jgi:hypothetical protein